MKDRDKMGLKDWMILYRYWVGKGLKGLFYLVVFGGGIILGLQILF